MEQYNIKVSNLIAKLKIAYPYYFKELKEEELLGLYAMYQDMLSEYNEQTLNNAIKSIMKKSKYMPSLSEIIEECDNNKTVVQNSIIDLMIANNYFSDSKEIEKAYKWLERGIIPEWFKKDMRKYYQKELSHEQVKTIATTQTKETTEEEKNEMEELLKEYR